MQLLLKSLPRTGLLSRQQYQICMCPCTRTAQKLVPFFLLFKLTLIYLLQPQLSLSRSFKYDIPVFFEIEVLAKL